MFVLYMYMYTYYICKHGTIMSEYYDSVFLHCWDVWALKQCIMYPDTQLFLYILSKVYSSETTNNEKYDHHSLGVRT